MSRSGYTEEYEYLDLYRASVDRAIKGKRGQTFLLQLARALDEMLDKKLATGRLKNAEGEVCALGAACNSLGLDVKELESNDNLSKSLNIALALVKEIEFMNDDEYGYYHPSCSSDESDDCYERWQWMKEWVNKNILTPN